MKLETAFKQLEEWVQDDREFELRYYDGGCEVQLYIKDDLRAQFNKDCRSDGILTTMAECIVEALEMV